MPAVSKKQQKFIEEFVPSKRERWHRLLLRLQEQEKWARLQNEEEYRKFIDSMKNKDLPEKKKKSLKEFLENI